mmetsp:Transcript_82559/g.260693  ORF Transcript_82559/g.260693 Transcript_82559/m.260693 type:complete len:409 (+) Transcript_82559:72-1298(+)
MQPTPGPHQQAPPLWLAGEPPQTPTAHRPRAAREESARGQVGQRPPGRIARRPRRTPCQGTTQTQRWDIQPGFGSTRRAPAQSPAAAETRPQSRGRAAGRWPRPGLAVQAPGKPPRQSRPPGRSRGRSRVHRAPRRRASAATARCRPGSRARSAPPGRARSPGGASATRLRHRRGAHPSASLGRGCCPMGTSPVRPPESAPRCCPRACSERAPAPCPTRRRREALAAQPCQTLAGRGPRAGASSRGPLAAAAPGCPPVVSSAWTAAGRRPAAAALLPAAWAQVARAPAAKAGRAAAQPPFARPPAAGPAAASLRCRVQRLAAELACSSAGPRRPQCQRGGHTLWSRRRPPIWPRPQRARGSEAPGRPGAAPGGRGAAACPAAPRAGRAACPPRGRAAAACAGPPALPP